MFCKTLNHSHWEQAIITITSLCASYFGTRTMTGVWGAWQFDRPQTITKLKQVLLVWGWSNSLEPKFILNRCQISLDQDSCGAMGPHWFLSLLLTHFLMWAYLFVLFYAILFYSRGQSYVSRKTQDLGPTLFPPPTRQLKWPTLIISTLRGLVNVVSSNVRYARVLLFLIRPLHLIHV